MWYTKNESNLLYSLTVCYYRIAGMFRRVKFLFRRVKVSFLKEKTIFVGFISVLSFRPL